MKKQQHSHNKQQGKEELDLFEKFGSFIQERSKNFLVYSIAVSSCVVFSFLVFAGYIYSQGDEISLECKAIPLSCEIKNF